MANKGRRKEQQIQRPIGGGGGSAAQICLLDGVGLRQLMAGAGECDLSGFQHIGPVRHLQGHFGVLFHQQDGGAGLMQLPDDSEDLSHQNGGKAHGGLVQHQQLGVAPGP